ncbi:hypothetical protein DL765_002777 [Monosporascus sp. GIB2]|nr:hypothetical protein DL765_002777 [Monosporascus sp. GIB2]
MKRGPDPIDPATLEKEDAMHLEFKVDNRMAREDAEFLNNFPKDKKRAVIRKIDYRLVPMLVLLYLMAYLDKTNIGNAKIEGLLESLNMTGVQYNVAVSIFFIPFVLAEVPSNMILHRFKKPSMYMGGLVTGWGVIMTLTGVVQNYAGLIAVRFFLGLFEAGFLPGAILIISKWYLPNETQTRIAILYTSAASGGAFSGLLAFAIAKLDGLGGYEGWRWRLTGGKIFILEGLATVFIGALCFTLLIDSPALSTKWLDADEVRYLELRQQSRRITKPSEFREHHFDKELLFSVLTDWKIYLLILANWSNAVPNYAMKFAMPQVIKNMGMYPILPGVNAWNVANSPDPGKRAISIGFLVCVGNIGGLIGSYIYLEEEAPEYPTGYGTSLGFASVGIMAVIVLELILLRRNKQKAQLSEDEIRQQYSDGELDGMGEKSPLFSLNQ